MADKSWRELCGYAKFGIVIILIVTVGRWALGFGGVPYHPRGNVLFSIVLATNFLAIAYGGFLRAYSPLSYKQIIITALFIVLSAQLLIVFSTAISYMAGLETYFNHPEALNSPDAVPFGDAMLARAGGLVINSAITVVTASIGYALGGTFPKHATS